MFGIARQSAGRVKRSVPVSNRVLTLTGTSLRFFTRPVLISGAAERSESFRVFNALDAGLRRHDDTEDKAEYS